MRAEDLNRPDQFPHPTSTIHWRETHISLVILTGEWVYKIKKPVNFGFLDFSTVELRKLHCEEEIRLNRRTAPGLYISVEPLYCADGDYNFCGKGDVVDYAVKMRQFDPDALLQNCMPQVLMDDDFFQALGYALAGFHDEAAVCGEGSEFGNAESVLFPVQENFDQIIDGVSDEVDIKRLKTIEAWSLDQYKNIAEVFDQRKREGKIRECHGDLHLANIALVDGKPLMFDCIEFNERFRWIDVASDLAFLIMDMTVKGYGYQANVLLNSYLEYSLDYEALQVLDFYVVYRAMVRAKVSVLTMRQAAEADRLQLLTQFRAYMDYALSCMDAPHRYLAITCGVSGSGKSTLARKVAAHSGGIRLRSDVIRKHLAGLKPLQSSRSHDPDSANAIYSRSYSIKTFETLEALSRKVLNYGYPTLVDATFIKSHTRAPFFLLAKEEHVPFYVLFMDVPTEVLKRRILLREREGRDASEAGVAVMEQQLLHCDGFSAEEESCVIRCDDNVDSDSISELVKFMIASTPLP